MTRYFLLFYLLFYVLLAFMLPTVRVWRKIAKNPLVLGSTDSAHDFIGRVFKLLFMLLAVVLAVYAAVPGIYQYMKPLGRLERFEIWLTGIILLIASLLWTILAQFQMRDSWRIGIDYEMKTNLVQTGIYRFSRNPIFLGMQATLLGLFFVLPNAFTLLVLVLGIVLIQIQVRLEEDFLAKTHGIEYEEYQNRTRRWL